MAGPAPDIAKINGQLQKQTKLLETMLKNASINADNFLDLRDEIDKDLEGNFLDDQLRGLLGIEAGLAAGVSPAAARSVLDPIVRRYGQFIGETSTDALALARQHIPRYFDDNGITIKSRGIVPGTPAITVATGDGAIRALRVDANGNVPEHLWAETYLAEIIRDATAGPQRNREVFRITGATRWPTELQRTGSGTDQQLACVDARQSILRNAGFDQKTGPALTPTGITGWTPDVPIIGDGSDFEFDAVNIYQDRRNSTESRFALNIKLPRILTQRLDDRGLGLARTSPMYGQIAFNAEEGLATGSLTFSLGTLTVTVVVDGLVGYQLLILPLTAAAWPRNLYADPLTATVDASGLTGGELLVDDVILRPFTTVTPSNEWLIAIGGQTPFQERDKIAWTNTLAGSIIQRWIWRAYDWYWPHSGAPSITDPV